MTTDPINLYIHGVQALTLFLLVAPGCGRTALDVAGVGGTDVTGGFGGSAQAGGFPGSGGTLAGSGGVRSAGGVAGSGGIVGTGTTVDRAGTSGSGGVESRGGLTGSGGVTGAGGASSSGGAACGSDVTPCAGDVSGTWTVVSGCLQVSGQMDVTLLGLGCSTADVTGTLHVTGTWTANSDGAFVDDTTTTGNEVLTLPAACLFISGTTVTCPNLNLSMAVYYSEASCTDAVGGGCTCAGTVNQQGEMGVVTPSSLTRGDYRASNGTLMLEDGTTYSYCVSNDNLTVTPQRTSPVTTGEISLREANTTGSGGTRTGGVKGSGGVVATGGMMGGGGQTSSQNDCEKAGGTCDQVSPGVCSDGWVPDTGSYSCGSSMMVCCLPVSHSPCETAGGTCVYDVCPSGTVDVAALPSQCTTSLGPPTCCMPSADAAVSNLDGGRSGS